MKLVFRATTPADAPQLISFLARAYSIAPQSECLRPDLLHWKFWSPREDFSKPRSYVLERNGEIVAHQGVWPMILRTATETFQGCHGLDWASDPSVPGAGVAIKRRISELFDFEYAIDYSEMAARALPAMGFKQVGEAWSAARPLRPLQQILSHQYLDWKIPARLVRNAMWSVIPLTTAIDGWAMTEGLGEDESDWPSDDARVYALRSNAFLRYLQSCPAATIRVFQIQKDGQNVGRIALSFLQHQVRVVGVWLDRPSQEELHVSYSLVQQAVRTMDSAFEIVVSGSTPISRDAAVSAGLRVCKRKHRPIYLLCRNTSLPTIPFEFQIADTDAVFLSMGSPSYYT